MIYPKRNPGSPKGRSPKNRAPGGHPFWRISLTGVAATDPASLEHLVLAQADLYPKAQALYGQGVRMGLLFAQGGVRMRKNGSNGKKSRIR